MISDMDMTPAGFTLRRGKEDKYFSKGKGWHPTLIHSNFPLTNFIFGSEIAKYNWSKSISVTNIPPISEVY